MLYSFSRFANDGEQPETGLIDVNGTPYGTTTAGGAYGYGTVFKLSTAGQETVLYNFKGGADGEYPQASLISVNGALYGTTSAGGGSAFCEYGCGTVFEISAAGKESILHAFTGKDGSLPEAGLIDVNGVFYGTTLAGGTDGCGTVFKLVR